MNEDGFLRYFNAKSSYTTNIDDFEFDSEDYPPAFYLPVALILTYSNSLYGTSKEPLIIQEGYGQLPASHHERLRKLEKRIKWDEDIAFPGRIKYSLTGDDIVDTNGESLTDIPLTSAKSSTDEDTKDVEKVSDKHIFTTTDENGNTIVKLADSVTEKLTVTLKEKTKDSDGKELKLAETDILNVSSFASLENMVHDSTEGTLKLGKKELGTKDSTKKEKSSSTKDDSKSSSKDSKSSSKNSKSSSKNSKSSSKDSKSNSKSSTKEKTETKVTSVTAKSLTKESNDIIKKILSGKKATNKEILKLLNDEALQSGQVDTSKIPFDKIEKLLSSDKKYADVEKKYEQIVYNVWNQSSENKIYKSSKGEYKIKEREYKVIASSKEKKSYYPGMTFYTSKDYKMKKLYLPIYKFQN